MFVHPRLKTVAVFTPPALPSFFVIPTAIPNQTLFCRPSSYRSLAYSALFQPHAKNRLAPWLVSVQRLTLHLAALVQLRVSPATLAAEFPLLSLSIVSRVPSCHVAAVTHFDEHTGWLTTPFLGGYPPP